MRKTTLHGHGNLSLREDSDYDTTGEITPGFERDDEVDRNRSWSGLRGAEPSGPVEIHRSNQGGTGFRHTAYAAALPGETELCQSPGFSRGSGRDRCSQLLTVPTPRRDLRLSRFRVSRAG